MLKKVTDAVPQMVEQASELAQLEASLIGVDAGETLEAWRTMAADWEKDHAKPNPFETKHKDEHLAEVRHALAKEAEAREQAKTALEGSVREDMHLTEWLSGGLQLQIEQYVFSPVRHVRAY